MLESSDKTGYPDHAGVPAYNRPDILRPKSMCEKPFSCGMGIMPMCRRAILALQFVFFPRAGCPCHFSHTL